LEHKAYWAIKWMNHDLNAAVVKWRIEIRELEEMRLKAYVQAYTRRELKGVMTKGWKRKSLKKDIRSSSTIRGL
jgi:hypothetical protein